ncbi:dihydrodipicolinate reductase C-terminal domain-containing protein [Erwinia piriflorinigrans]|uniref:4-hydroxy-tetrahydrodipicolinate reductase n=1 Tax=Erwinia piriflorinigrans CFBP 5888 TaxID=1161919 RepID=V5Z9I5_9GAMM|nr:dihydrodipicolinate reductase C-terminal domain-containing protein [Erwinia piriflorinigrans]CCG87600.1 Dihydrodipicolinate reductase DHPR [Erwinia piriflorinigrans CFBP 5888]
MKHIRVGVVGFTGRLGNHACTVLQKKNYDLSLLVSSHQHIFHSPPQVIFECAHHSATKKTIELARRFNCAVIFATSGREEADEAYIREAAKDLPVIIATNLAQGALLQARLSLFANEHCGACEKTIIDRHASIKQDRPGGTARRLAAMLDAKIETLRYGQGVADHHVVFHWQDETLEITHRTFSLLPAVNGAIRAIDYALNINKPGLYDFSQCVTSLGG